MQQAMNEWMNEISHQTTQELRQICMSNPLLYIRQLKELNYLRNKQKNEIKYVLKPQPE